MHHSVQIWLLGCILILASACWRSSCSLLCWLGRERGTQSIPSVSGWHTRLTARWGYQRVVGPRSQEMNQQVPRKLPTNRPTVLPPRFTSLAALVGRKKSGSVTSCLRPWMWRETHRGLADLWLDQVCKAFAKHPYKCDMCVDYKLCIPVLCFLKINPLGGCRQVIYLLEKKKKNKEKKR